MWKVSPGIVILSLGACGDPDAVCSDDGGEACFVLPTEALVAHEVGGASPDVVLGCEGPVGIPSSMPVTVSGQIRDFDSDEPVDGATLEVFETGEYDVAIAEATTDANGDYTFSLAANTPDLLWGRITGDGVVTQLRHQLLLDLSQATLDLDYTTATEATLDSAAANVGVERDPELAQLVVMVTDCGQLPLSRAAVVLSRTSGQRDFVGGVPVFYSVIGDFPLPVTPEDSNVTSRDGTAVALDVPLDGDLYVQAWGFVEAGDVAAGEDGLTLIAEHQVARRAGATTWVNLWSNQD